MGACENFRNELAKKSKPEVGFCCVEVVFLLFSGLFALLGMSALRGASPQVWSSKLPCGKVAGQLSNTCGTTKDNNGTCYADKEAVGYQTCPPDIALKGCRVYSSNAEVFSASLKAKAEVKVLAVSGTVVEWGRQSTEWDKRCGFTDTCKPVTSLLHMEKAPSKPVPEALIWLLYKLLGLAPVIFEIMLLTCLCRMQDQTLGVFEEIIGFGSGFWWFLDPAGWIRRKISSVQWIIKFLKFKVMPNLLFAEIAGMEGHPTCKEMVVSRMIPNVTDFAYFGLLFYTITAMIVYIVYVKKRGEDLLTEKEGTETKILAVKKGDWRNSKTEKFLTVAMCFMVFLDIAGVMLIGIYYMNVVHNMGGILGFDFAIGFAFNLHFAVTIDLFQLSFLGLSVVETAHALMERASKVRKIRKWLCGGTSDGEGDEKKPAEGGNNNAVQC